MPEFVIEKRHAAAWANSAVPARSGSASVLFDASWRRARCRMGPKLSDRRIKLLRISRAQRTTAMGPDQRLGSGASDQHLRSEANRRSQHQG